MKDQFVRKILILDDNEELIDKLKRGFGAKGHPVYVGAKGLNELILSGKGMPDLIVLDTMVGDMNVYEFFKKLKQDEGLCHIKTIVLTARRGLRETYEKLGCDYFIEKPYNADEVIATGLMLMIRELLILESSLAVRAEIENAFPSELYQIIFVSNTEQMRAQLREHYYHRVACSALLVRDEPNILIARINRDSRNKGIRIFFYYAESGDPDEADDVIEIGKLQLKWEKVTGAIYYDGRTTRQPFIEFLQINLR